MFSISLPSFSFFSLFISSLTFLPQHHYSLHAHPQPLFLPPTPAVHVQGFNNRLSVAHWRHLASPPDTGHSVWVQEGRMRGVDMTLHSPSTTTTWETQAGRPSMWGKRESVECYFSLVLFPSRLSSPFLSLQCNTPSFTHLSAG